MDLRLVSLLLLLIYVCGARSRTTRNYTRITPRHQQQQPQLSMQRRSDDVLKRPVCAVSEFLEPPPLPANHRPFPSSPPNYRLRNPNSNNSPNQKHATRNGRYARPSQNVDPGYLSNLISWLNPFGNGAAPAATSKEAHAQASSNFPQYAPRMPYTGGHTQQPYFGAASNGPTASTHQFPKSSSAWISAGGNNCNPCDVFPWTPVIRNDLPFNPGQYAANFGANSYAAAGPPAGPPGTSGYSYSPPSSAPPSQHFGRPGPTHQRDNYPTANPHLASAPTPPLYPAQPFRDAPTDFLYSVSSSAAVADQQPPPPVFHQEATAPFNSHPHRQNHPQQQQQQQYQQQQHQYQQEQQQYQQEQQQYQQQQYQQPSPIEHQPLQFDLQQPQAQYNHEASVTSNQQYNIHIQQSPIIDVEPAAASAGPIKEEEHSSSGLDYHQASATNVEPIGPQYQSPPPYLDVTKDAPYDLNGEINEYRPQDADHAESRPLIITSSSSSSGSSEANEHSRTSGTSVHFQRSPLVELSVAGESTTPSSSNRFSTKPKAKANAESSTVAPRAPTLIDYIVQSSPRETSNRQETRPTTTTTTTTSTTSRPDTNAVIVDDQKQQESRIETLVQAYEFYKSNNNNRTKLNETTRLKIGGGDGDGSRVSSENSDDFSASREAQAPSNSSDNAKKIIIPYTSQYTPSPFHPTKSVQQQQQQQVRQREDYHRPEQTPGGQTVKQLQRQQQDLGHNSVEEEGDNAVIQQSRRVPSTTPAPTQAPEPALRNNHTGNSIDVHRLQKNIDNWTIQEFSKRASAIRNLINATYPRWLSSKQIPDEYLLATAAAEEEEGSNEYYDFSSRETHPHRGINRLQVQTSTTTSTTTTTTTTTTTEPPSSRVKVVKAIYPKSTKKSEYLPKPSDASSSNSSEEKEKVYVVTPIPNPNSLLEDSKSRRVAKVKQHQDSSGLEQAYQVLPQAVNNLAVMANAPESAAPALWGIMEHEQIASSPNQPRWRSESDVLPEPASTPVLYAGHSKVTYFRTKVH